MKDHFIRLFQYDHHANLLILETITAENLSEKAVQIMAHMLAAQQIWLKRCKSLPAPGGPLWPDWQVDEMKTIVEENNQAWTDYLQQLDNADLQQNISYQNTQGQAFNNTLIDIITHVVNHGTHHRAQAGQYLKLAGVEKLPATDYILYIRQQNL